MTRMDSIVRSRLIGRIKSHSINIPRQNMRGMVMSSPTNRSI